MRGDESRSALDALIDDTAGAITRGEPSSRLRSRVAERILEPPVAWPVSVWKPALAGASIVLMVALLWPRADERVERGAERPAARPSSLSGAATAGVLGVKPGPRPGLQRSMVEHGSALAETSAEIEPIDVPPLAIERIGPEPVVLDVVTTPMPLTIERLQIEPIAVGEVEHEVE